jgi:hypothetical protein
MHWAVLALCFTLQAVHVLIYSITRPPLCRVVVEVIKECRLCNVNAVCRSIWCTRRLRQFIADMAHLFNRGTSLYTAHDVLAYYPLRISAYKGPCGRDYAYASTWHMYCAASTAAFCAHNNFRVRISAQLERATAASA